MMLTYFDVRPAIPFVAQKPETRFKIKVLRDLKTLDSTWFYKASDRVRSGIPDILLCRHGYFVAIELKVDSPISRLQQYNLDKIRGSGGHGWIVTPDNWEMLFEQLKEIK